MAPRTQSQAHVLSCDIQGLPLPRQVSQASFTLAAVQVLTHSNTVRGEFSHLSAIDHVRSSQDIGLSPPPLEMF